MPRPAGKGKYDAEVGVLQARIEVLGVRVIDTDHDEQGRISGFAKMTAMSRSAV